MTTYEERLGIYIQELKILMDELPHSAYNIRISEILEWMIEEKIIQCYSIKSKDVITINIHPDGYYGENVNNN